MMGVPQVMRFVEVANEDFKKSPPKKQSTDVDMKEEEKEEEIEEIKRDDYESQNQVAQQQQMPINPLAALAGGAGGQNPMSMLQNLMGNLQQQNRPQQNDPANDTALAKQYREAIKRQQAAI